LAALLLTASTASAATEVGWDCTANGSEPGWTLLAASGSNLPMADYVPPEGPKVITGWRVKVGPGLGSLPQRLEVFEIKNEEHEFEKIGESATETLVEGTNSFETRIAADEGDSVGLYGPAGTLVCREAGAVSRLFEGSVATGEVKPFKTVDKDLMPLEVGTPLVVTVEDDRDGDGYGDETQDKCLENAALHTNCPPVTAQSKAEAKQKSILVRVGVSSEATIDVYGQVGWGFKPSPKLKTAGSKPTRLIIGLSGPKRTVLPGKRVPFRVPLPKAVLRRLGRLTPKESLTAKLTVSCTDLAGRIQHQRLDVKLRGRGQ
jgi:hypothetical protein